ncbi:MAG: PAS domain S-box protein [Anaerolineales bacterium]|nr:PAS domain S-box protein [Anaerolineales bacterium]
MSPRIRRFFAAPIFDNEEKTRAARILLVFGWFVVGAASILFLARLLTGDWHSFSSKYFFPAITLGVFAMRAVIGRGYVREAAIFAVAFFWLALTYHASQSDGLRDVALIAHLAVIILAGLLLGWREGLLIGLLSIAAIWFFAFEEQQGLRQFDMDPSFGFARDLTSVFILSGVLVYLIIYYLNRSLSDAKLELRERLRADEKMQVQAQYLTALHETALGLVNRLELNPLLESILDRASELLDTPHVGIDLLTPDESALKQVLGKGVYANWNGTLTHKGVGLTGKVWEQGITIFTQSYEEYQYRNPETTGLVFGAVVGTPLKSGQKVVGSLLVASMDEQKKFTPEQVILLERLAALASVAIDNARLYEEAQMEIGERTLIEQELRTSEGRFRKVFDNNKIAISIVTLEEGIFLEANEAFWRLSGLFAEQALGHSSLELALWSRPEDRARFVQELLEKASLHNVEVEFPQADGANRISLGYYELITIKDQLCILCMFYDVTEQKQVERAFKESEERFRKVFQSSPVAICITTLEEGRLLDANEAYWKLSKYDPATSIGKLVEELDIWDSMDDRRLFTEKLKTDNSVFNPNYEFFDAVGNPRHVTAFYEKIEINGEACILSMFYDITDQKTAQDALFNAEARTRAILNSIPDMIFEVSRDGIFLDFMASTELTPVSPPEQFIGRHIAQLFPPTISDQTIFLLERAIATGQLHAFEYGMPPGEEIQFFEARISAVTSESAIMMVRDISQRRWVETEREKLINELEEKNAESETLRESMAIIVETLDETRAVSLILDQLEKVIPHSSASVQLLKDGMLEIVSTRGLDPHEGYIGTRYVVDENEPSQPILTGQAPYVLINEVHHETDVFVDEMYKDIHAWMAIPLRVKGRIIGIIALDGHKASQFTKKQAELAVTYANQVAIALENARLFSELQMELSERKRLIVELEGKNAELERFTYTVSHDLKSPLITIKGFLGFLEKDASSGNFSRLRGDIRRIADATDKMQTLLNELLELSRVGRLVNPSQSVQFSELVYEALEIVQGRLRTRNVQVNVRENLPTIYGDRQRLLEVLQNLLDNAAKFIGENPNPLIEIGQAGDEEGKPILFVRDNGMGIDPVHHERVFGLFNKLDADSEGTGIGLALVKRIIEIHGGRIWVQSEAGQGTTFYFTLPTQSDS